VTAREITDEVRAARDAGAAVVHVHEPLNADGSRRPGAEAWLEIARIIRQECDVIYQHGQGGSPYILWENDVPPVPPEEPGRGMHDKGIDGLEHTFYKGNNKKTIYQLSIHGEWCMK